MMSCSSEVFSGKKLADFILKDDVESVKKLIKSTRFAYEKDAFFICDAAYALEKRAWNCFKFLLNSSTPHYIKGRNLLDIVIFKIANEQNPTIIKEVFEAVISAGLNPSEKDIFGTTLYQKAVLTNNSVLINAFKERDYGSDEWPSPLTIKDLKAIANDLEKKICEGYYRALKEKKNFLLVIGEEHNSFESKLIEAMALNILQRLNIKNYYIEIHPKHLSKDLEPSDFLEKMDECIAQTYKTNCVAIDTNIQLDQKLDEKQSAIREKKMVIELLHQNASGMVKIGYSHLGMFKGSKELNETYSICMLTTSFSEYIKIDYDWDKDYARQTRLKSFEPGQISQSQDIVHKLASLSEKKSIADKEKYLTELGLLKTLPIILPKQYNVKFLEFNQKICHLSGDEFKEFVRQFCETLKQTAPQKRSFCSYFKALHYEAICQFATTFSDPPDKRIFMQAVIDLADNLDHKKSVRTKQILLSCMVIPETKVQLSTHRYAK